DDERCLHILLCYHKRKAAPRRRTCRSDETHIVVGQRGGQTLNHTCCITHVVPHHGYDRNSRVESDGDILSDGYCLHACAIRRTFWSNPSSRVIGSKGVADGKGNTSLHQSMQSFWMQNFCSQFRKIRSFAIRH